MDLTMEKAKGLLEQGMNEAQCLMQEACIKELL